MSTALSHIGKVAKTGGKTMPAVDAASSFASLLSTWRDYQKTCEVEETRRESIRADRDVRLAAIKEQANLLNKALEETFKERAAIFGEAFELLEKGINSDNNKAVDSALAMIMAQIKESPMKQAVQLIQDIKNPDVLEVEI